MSFGFRFAENDTQKRDTWETRGRLALSLPVLPFLSAGDAEEGAPVVAPRPPWTPLPHQVPPAGTEWDTWAIIAGRGSGKTRGAAEYVLQHLRELGPKARVGVGAPDLAAVRDVCAEGETGLITIARDEFAYYHRSIGYCEARHKGGGYVRFAGSEARGSVKTGLERFPQWNGPQWSLLWWDEWALVNFGAYRESQLGLRLGAWPRTVITATPKAIAMRELADLEKRPGVVVTRAATDDNPHLPARRKAELYRDFGGTTTGRSELGGELVYDTEGALWKHEWIERARVAVCPPLVRIVVAIDPAGGSGNQSAQTGLCAAGLGVDGDYYVLALEGVQEAPDEWLDRAVALYHRLLADALLGEMNYGGPFIRRMVQQLPDSVNFAEVYATRGKVVRAEPIARLDAKGRIHHVGHFPDGEAQLCSFPLTKRKDMADARVWAITSLIETKQAGSFDELPGSGELRDEERSVFAGIA